VAAGSQTGSQQAGSSVSQTPPLLAIATRVHGTRLQSARAAAAN
jgi:hypothetical protein